MIVVKLGGSLYDHPALRSGLNEWLDRIDGPVVIVPGGGGFAESVREFDRIHGLDSRHAHWAAIQSLTIAADLVESLLVRNDVRVLDPYTFCRENDTLPHSWSVTTDSIALHLAMTIQAEGLWLLKSTDQPDSDWSRCAELGFVDRFFPELITQAKLVVEAVNFRKYLETHSSVDSK